MTTKTSTRPQTPAKVAHAKPEPQSGRGPPGPPSSSTARPAPPASRSAAGWPPSPASRSRASTPTGARTRTRAGRSCSEVDLVVLCLPDDAAKEAVGLAASLGKPTPPRSSMPAPPTAWRRAGPTALPRWRRARPRPSRRRAASPIPAATRPAPSRSLRPLVEAGLMPADYPVTVNAVSGYSGGGRSMIEAYEAGAAPAFELYGLGLRAQAPARAAALRQAHAPADLRALRRQLPAGHAGERAAASRHAARQAVGARSGSGAIGLLCRRRAGDGGAGRRRLVQGRPARCAGPQRHGRARAARLRQRRSTARPCSSPASTTSARARRAPPCRTSA